MTWVPIGMGAEQLAAIAPAVWLGQSRVIYQWGRIEQLNQWWHWLLLILLVGLIAAHVIHWYRRDWGQLPRPVGWTLLLLRLAAFGGILLYFFQFDRRVEQRMVRDSRVAVLVDTSLSMTSPGTPTPSGVPASISRYEEALRFLEQSPLLAQLAARHQVTLYRFDQSPRPIALAALEKRGSDSNDSQPRDAREPESGLFSPPWIRGLVWTATVGAAVAVLLVMVSWLTQLLGMVQWTAGPWLLLVGSGLWLLSLLTAALGIVPSTHLAVLSLWSANPAPQVAIENPIPGDTGGAASNSQTNFVPTDWAEALNPSGVESRIGDALRSVLDRELGNPLAGIIVLTDGRNNAGVDPKSAIPIAQNARVPIYPVGLGSEKRPANLQLVELDAPRRLYPGDRFTLSALVGSVGYDGRAVTVQFLSGGKEDSLDRMQLETETTVNIPADGSLAAASVELPPRSVGSWSYAARVIPLAGEADEIDNVLRTEVEVIERQNRVLIVAGGPLREYQFVRNLLYRDQDVQSHVYLQSGSRSTSQEAQKLLDEFPADRAALSDYDAILAFDADWMSIPESALQAVEKWVAEQAGGLFLLAGSVETPKWLARSAAGLRPQLLRDLSPVILDVRGSALLAAGRVEGESPWPLTITPDGKQTEFLWLTDEPASSLELWQSFSGVHTYFSAFDLKPGAKALALFSDPRAAAGGQQPIYLASQFYGAGRVVFQGGGEMWRLRSLGDQYFDRYYTKLVRWISQGRLLLDSDRGVLLVDREEAVQGEQVGVRAVLKNERYEPLVQSEVVARLIDPGGLNSPLVLRPLIDGSQPGVYSGQFPALAAGNYRIQLQLGGLASTEFLRAQVQVRVPKLEMQNIERNDLLLGQLAAETGGQYWKGVESAAAPLESGQLAIVEAISPQDQVLYSPGAPEREFQLRWLAWLMVLIATSLSMEWLSRRIHRLA